MLIKTMESIYSDEIQSVEDLKLSVLD